MKLKVVEIEKGRVFLEDNRAGGVEMDLSQRSLHLAKMDLKEGDLVEVTLKKVQKKPVEKKSVKKK